MHDLEKLCPDLASAIVAAAEAGETRKLKDLVDRAEHSLRVLWYVPPFARKPDTPDSELLAKKSMVSFVERLPKVRPTIAQFIAATRAKIVHKKVKDCLGLYHDGEDRIHLLPQEDYPNDSEYYSTLFHELVHWTAPRLGRSLDDVVGEELVAEIGARTLTAHFAITTDHTEYLAGWFRSVPPQTRDEVWGQAEKKAEQAVAYLLAL